LEQKFPEEKEINNAKRKLTLHMHITFDKEECHGDAYALAFSQIQLLVKMLCKENSKGC